MNYTKKIKPSEIKYRAFFFSGDYKNKLTLPLLGESIILIDKDNVRYTRKMHSSGARIDGFGDLYDKYKVKAGDLASFRVDKKGEIYVDFEADNNLYFDSEEKKEKISKIEDLTITPSLEIMLEDFIVANLDSLEKGLILYFDKINNKSGRQYTTDIGNIDLLCKDKNNKFVIIELKKGKESDKVVGQISRYIGWVKQNLANNEDVRGIVITPRPTNYSPIDNKLRYAVLANPSIELRYYEINLKFFEKGKTF